MKTTFARCLVICLTLYSVSSNAVDTDSDDNIYSSQITNGQSTFFMDKDTQNNAGLITLKLKIITFHPELIRYGQAISIQPLQMMLNQYLLAKAKQTSAKALLTQAEKNISRLRSLHKNEAISTRKLQYQQSQWKSQQAIYQQTQFQTQSIIDSSQLLWGKKLTHWATSQNTQFKALLSGQSTLLKISLPAGQSLSNQTQTIAVDPAGNRQYAISATLIDQLPQTDSFSQGLQYLFITGSPVIRAGMNFTSWIHQQENSQSGVIIPESALAWHRGEAFVFLKSQDEQFIHQTIEQPLKVAEGYFIADQLQDNTEIVTVGTQTLLSHEFKSQIPAEDDDDDD